MSIRKNSLKRKSKSRNSREKLLKKLKTKKRKKSNDVPSINVEEWTDDQEWQELLSKVNVTLKMDTLKVYNPDQKPENTVRQLKETRWKQGTDKRKGFTFEKYYKGDDVYAIKSVGKSSVAPASLFFEKKKASGETIMDKYRKKDRDGNVVKSKEIEPEVFMALVETSYNEGIGELPVNSSDFLYNFSNMKPITDTGGKYKDIYISNNVLFIEKTTGNWMVAPRTKS